MSDFKIFEDQEKKIFSSDSYNYVFSKQNGFFASWGKTQSENPEYCEHGPVIADIEISEVCSGVKGIGVCKFCYKSNTPNGRNMSLETFKRVFHNLPKTLTQIAFGIGDLPYYYRRTFGYEEGIWGDEEGWVGGNPDMRAIFEYTRSQGVIPNVTINGEGLTDEWADWFAKTCGAIAVSVYDWDKSFDAVKKLTDRGMDQVNIHFMISEETVQDAHRLILAKKVDPRLAKLNAIVFLSLKPKGRSIGKYNQLPQHKFNLLIYAAMHAKINWGCDSCSAQKVLIALKDHPDIEHLKTVIEPCESTCTSIYINTVGDFYPCSFMEGEENWKTGLSVSSCSDFLNDVWYHPRTVEFRNKVLSCHENCISCPHFNV